MIRFNNKKIKSNLLCATIASLMISSSAIAQDSVALDLSQKPISSSTLNYLNSNKFTQHIQVNSDGNVVSGYVHSNIYKTSSYTLTEATNIDPSKLPDNVITKYVKTNVTEYYHPETGVKTLADELEEGVNYKEVSVPQVEAKYYTVTGSSEYSPGNNVTGDFIFHESSSDRGGALYEPFDVNNIVGDFIKNKILDNKFERNTGGALAIDSTVKNIVGDFYYNSIEAQNLSSMGGAIYNSGTISNIIGDFVGNNAYSGNAIYNAGTIEFIKGDFIANINKHYNSNIYNSGTMGTLKGDFINNVGTVISNQKGQIDSIEGTFYDNDGKNIEIRYGTVKNILADFISNDGNCLHNSYGVVNVLSGNFVNNITNSEGLGGAKAGVTAAIYNYNGLIESIIGDFINNSAISTNSYGAMGGVINNSTTNSVISEIRADFIANSAISNDSAIHRYKDAQGGAIYNLGQINNIVNSNFYSNYAKSANGKAQGGAIYSTTDLNILADNGTSIFSGNYVESAIQGKDYQAIYMASREVTENNKRHFQPATLNLEAKNNGIIQFNDKIAGASEVTINNIGYAYNPVTKQNELVYLDESNTIITDDSKLIKENYKVNIKGDSSGTVILNNNIEGVKEDLSKGIADINLYTVTLHLGKRDNVLNDNNLTLNSGTLSLINNEIGISRLNTLTISGDTKLAVDVDLQNKTMDTISAANYGSHSGKIILSGVNLLNDLKEEKSVAIYFAESALKNYITTEINETAENTYKDTIYAPVYKYSVTYDTENEYDGKGDGGYFLFTRGDKIPTGNASDAFNPAVLASPVAAQAGALSTINQTFNFSFQNSDNFMSIPYKERLAARNANKYALVDGNYSPLFSKQETSSVWVKPYSMFGNVPLKNGPKVNNVTYGTMIGFDGKIDHLKHGWDRVFTGFIGYNGSNQSFSSVDTVQTGGLIGSTLTFYKGNFFNATTISTGASVAHTTNMYGNEHFTMLMSGIANKSGYNLEFNEGKYIIQPNMVIGYSFINTFDYTNAAGVKIDSKPLHTIQLSPGVKFVSNLKNGWQPYMSVNMVWNLMGKSDVTANGIQLPYMSIKPYVQYGVGIQKRMKDRYMAYGQAMIQNGGRNGILLSAGFRWALGLNDKVEKVYRPENKKVLKEINKAKKAEK